MTDRSGPTRNAGKRRQPWTAVVQAKEFDDGIHVVFASDVVRHPSGIGMKIVHVRLTLGDQFFTNAHRKWQVRQPFPMQMADFPTADVKEYHSSAMRFRRHSGPRHHFARDSFGNR